MDDEEGGLKPGDNVWMRIFDIMDWSVEVDEPYQFDGTHDKKVSYNRKRMWNSLIAEYISPSQRDILLASGRFDDEELTPLPDEFIRKIANKIDGLTDFRKIDLSESDRDSPFDFDLSGMIFIELVLDNSEINTPLNLDDTFILERLSIQDCTFSSNISMCRAHIEKLANFRSSEFLGSFNAADSYINTAQFEYCHFEGKTNFQSAKISETSFSNANFKSETNFELAVFSKLAPKFYSTILHEDTSFQSVSWPLPISSTKTTDGPGAFIRAYECLRRHMAQQNKAQQEYVFLRLEMKCRKMEENFAGAMALWTYGLISDYGWSFIRPLLGVALVWVFGSVYFGFSVCGGHELGSVDLTNCSASMMAVSFSNLFSFLGIGRSFLGEELAQLNGSRFSELVGGIQMVFGPIFLFFILLALRNRFRMK